MSPEQVPRTETTNVKELVVISGKGGTGKTSITACLALLAEHPVIADCDVDAADLHLLLSPRVLTRRDFSSGREASIREKDCSGCGTCAAVCRFDAVRNVSDSAGRTTCAIDPFSCEGCGVCVRFCPNRAIDFTPRLCGEWMISRSRAGILVHARLGVASENSGKLVSLVRREAARIAREQGSRHLIVDGSPGIGCPVIASITGAERVLIVTEPSVSAEHDLNRVLSLAGHFEIPAYVCVNKWDLNPHISARIEKTAADSAARFAGRIRFDPEVTRAQIAERTVLETGAPSAEDIRELWQRISREE